MIEKIRKGIKQIDFNKSESYYFYFFLLINLLPVLCFKLFPTVDGPAHLYNSRLIVELLKHSASPFHHYFSFNTHITPNWSGHFILSFCLLFLPSFISEKVVLIIYLLGLPLSIRHLLKTLGIKHSYILYLVFPFTYSFLFYYGFYNFNIGLVFLFYGLSFWISYKERFTVSRFVKLLLISSLISLSHLFVFALFLLIIFILNFESAIELVQRKRRDTVKNYFLQLLCILPGLIMMINFLITNQSGITGVMYLSFKNIITSLKYIMPAKGISYAGYNTTSRILLYIFIIIIIYVFLHTAYKKIFKNQYIMKNISWLVICIIIFLLLFILPDYYNASTGFISSRLMLLLFLFLIIFLAMQQVVFFFRAMIFVIINFVNVNIIIHNYQSVASGCELAHEISAVSKFIKPYSVVLPINTSNNFLYAHISNYLGVDNPVILFENYEASLPHFPLKWNNNLLHTAIPISVNSKDSLEYVLRSNPLIDYVVVISDSRSEQLVEENRNLKNLIQANFTSVFIGKNATLKLYEKQKYH